MQNITVNDWKKYFPFSEVRSQQEQAINFILNSFLNDNKQVVLAELSTGVGKSAVGITVSRYLASHGNTTFDDDGEETVGTYVLTTQKVLQQQYVDDFGPCGRAAPDLLLSIKSATNYKCNFYSDQSCAESRRILSQLSKHMDGTEFQKNCKSNCSYAKDKQQFLESPISVTNFSYFLAETTYGKKLIPRGLLVVDECHSIEEQLSKFIDVTFSEKFAISTLKCSAPKDTSQNGIYKWVTKTYKPKLAKHIKSIEAALEKNFNAGVAFGDASKQYELLDKHICKINRFINSYNEDNWVLNITEPPNGSRAGRKFEFKTIDVSKYSHDALFKFGSRTLMMSATVINKDEFCKSIGLEPSSVAFITIPSPFPIENRLVHYIPAGSMSLKNIDKTLPLMAQVIKMIMEKHEHEKGIIHCTNFKISKYLEEHMQSNRLLTHSSTDRDDVLKFHISTNKPTVLLSPSMMEGVDLADNSSRFQIICKIPFPYLGDLAIKKRMQQNNAWYSYQTAKMIIQSLGRSIRNSNDFACSYILDSDWDRFYSMNKHIFPSDFSQVLRT